MLQHRPALTKTTPCAKEGTSWLRPLYGKSNAADAASLCPPTTFTGAANLRMDSGRTARSARGTTSVRIGAEHLRPHFTPLTTRRLSEKSTGKPPSAGPRGDFCNSDTSKDSRRRSKLARQFSWQSRPVNSQRRALKSAAAVAKHRTTIIIAATLLNIYWM